jgi:hypothetical protein
MDLPPTAWVILALGLLWLGLRAWSRKAEAQRQEARDARMAALLEERERLLGSPKPEAASARHEPEAPTRSGPRRCLGCGTVNDAEATLCSGCGLEL